MKELDRSRAARGGGYAVQTGGLARRFGGRTAVDRVDLLVPAGTALGYLGPDGVAAAFCCCTKSNAQAPAWAAYAESTSGRRS